VLVFVVGVLGGVFVEVAWRGVGLVLDALALIGRQCLQILVVVVRAEMGE